MDELIAFWRARLDEAEAIAETAGGSGPQGVWAQVDPERRPGRIDCDSGCIVTYDEGAPDEGQAAHIAANDPASVLADIAADRKIIDLLEEARERPPAGADDGRDLEEQELDDAERQTLERVAKIRAGRFSGHPEWRQEWAP